MLPEKYKEYSRISKNFLSLVLLQGTNFVIPILIIPYLIKTLGVDKYGIVALAQTTMLYFFIIVDYGFSLSAVKEISLNKNNIDKLSRIFSEVLITKLVLAILAFCILVVCIQLHPKFRENWVLFLLSYLMVIGQIAMPTWFFQGMDTMKYTTYTNLIAKVLFTGLIFFSIKKVDDAQWVNPLLGLGNIIAGIISTLFLIRRFGIYFITKGLWKSVQYQLKSGFYYFISNFSVSIYVNSNIVILGLFANDHVLGLYSIAEKIAMLTRQLLVVFSQAVYTHICVIVTEAKERMHAFLKKIFLPFFILVTLGCGILFIFAQLIPQYFGLNSIDSTSLVTLIRLISFIPAIVCLNIPFYQVLIHDNAKRGSKILVIGAVICILSNFILTPYLSSIGTGISMIITELFITASVILLVEKSTDLAIIYHKIKS